MCRKDLDQSSEVLEEATKDLILVLKYENNLFEVSILQLAKFANQNISELDEFDDSEALLEVLKQLTKETDEMCVKIGFECKNLNLFDDNPLPDLAEEDTTETSIPGLYFSQKVRGRLL